MKIFRRKNTKRKKLDDFADVINWFYKNHNQLSNLDVAETKAKCRMLIGFLDEDFIQGKFRSFGDLMLGESLDYKKVIDSTYGDSGKGFTAIDRTGIYKKKSGK